MDTEFPSVPYHVEAFGVDSRHDGMIHPGIATQDGGMIGVHVIENSSFLHLGKWIVDEKLGRFHPVDLSESTDEPDLHEIDAIEREIVRLVIWLRFWKTAQIPLAGPLVTWRNGSRISDQGHAPA